MVRKRSATTIRQRRTTPEMLAEHQRKADSMVEIVWKVVAGPPGSPATVTMRHSPEMLSRYGVK